MSAVSIDVETADLQLLDPTIDPSDFQINFSPALELPSLLYEIALLKIITWNTNHNLTGSKVLRWSADNGSTFFSITIPDGNYNIEDVNNLLRASQEEEGVTDLDGFGNIIYGIDILPNFNTNRVDILIDNTVGTGNTFLFDLTDGTNPDNIRNFLGFGSVMVSATQTGGFIANVEADVNSWVIECDLVRNSYKNGTISTALFTFKPKALSSEAFEIEPTHLKFLQVRRNIIESIRFKLVDSLGRKIDLRGEHITLNLQLKPIGRSG